MGWTFYNSSGQQLRNTGTVLATQAEMEAGSSIAAFVTPGRTQFHPGVVKVWAKMQSDGTIQDSYNVSGTGQDSTGIFSVTILTDVSTSTYCFWASAETGSGTFRSTNVSNAGTGAYKVSMFDSGHNLVNSSNSSGVLGDI